jgi:hypothetical protein
MSGAGAKRMGDVDLSGWPIVAVRVDDVTDAAELPAVVDAVTSALERQRPFGLLIGSELPLPEGNLTAEPLRWLRRRRAEIGTWCRGVVYLLPARAVARFPRAERAGARRLWGCDVEAVHDPDAARAWLLAHLDVPPDP